MTHITVPLVAIIILTWNQKELTLECLESLAQMEYPSERLELIVVDNGSNDGTVDSIQAQYPNVTLIRNNENLGFAEGNNVGLRYALKGSADFLMLLNNDTAVDKSLIDHLITAMQKDHRVGIVGPKMLYFDAPSVIWNAGNRIHWGFGRIERLGTGELDRREDEEPREVDYITACAIMFRREVIKQIGPLDWRFFIYFEETDWCMRARRAGWLIQYVPKARMWHKVSAAMGPTSPATDYYMTRNVILFLAKNGTGFGRLLFPSLAFGRHLVVVLAYTWKSHDGRRTPNRNARLLALRDALLGRWGPMGNDVASVCYPTKL